MVETIWSVIAVVSGLGMVAVILYCLITGRDDRDREEEAHVFFDEHFEANFLGGAWSAQFERIFGRDSRQVVCILNRHLIIASWYARQRVDVRAGIPMI